jgi:hypothetical protein
MIKVKLGTPKNEGFYEIEITMIKLRNGLPDSELFEKESIGKISVNVTHTGRELKEAAI